MKGTEGTYLLALGLEVKFELDLGKAGAEETMEWVITCRLAHCS